MNGLHCKCYSCTFTMQDKSNIPQKGFGSGVYLEHAIVSRLESDSIPHHVTDGNWLCTTSRPEVINADLKNSFDPSNTLFFLYTPSISSLGDLVCPASAVSASQHSKLFGAEFSLNDTLSQIGLDNCTNQAPGRDDQTKNILQGLVSAHPVYHSIVTYLHTNTGIYQPWAYATTFRDKRSLRPSPFSAGNHRCG